MRPPLTVRELASRISNMALVVALVAVALLAAWLVYAADYIGRVVNGPEPMTLAQLANTQSSSLYGRWLDFTAEVPARHLLKTTTTRRRGGTSITNHFVLISNRDGQIVETGNAELPPRFLAWASEFDQTSDYYQRSAKQLGVWAAGRGSISLSPVLLRTAGTVEFTRAFLGIGLAVGALTAIFLLWRAIRLKTDFTRVAPLARIRKSARAEEGMASLVADVDRQLALIDPKAQRTGVFTLPTWLVAIERNSFQLMSAEDAIWVVPYTVSKKFYGFTTSKRQIVQVIDRNRQKIGVATTSDGTIEMLQRLHRWAPWAVVGNNAEMEAQFGGQTKWRWPSKKKRARLIEAIDSRRKEILAAWARQAGARA
jgi:hypothetical protein